MGECHRVLSGVATHVMVLQIRCEFLNSRIDRYSQEIPNLPKFINNLRGRKVDIINMLVIYEVFLTVP